MHKKVRSNGCKSNYAIYVSGVGTRFNGELNIFQRALAMMQDHSGFGLGVGDRWNPTLRLWRRST